MNDGVSRAVLALLLIPLLGVLTLGNQNQPDDASSGDVSASAGDTSAVDVVVGFDGTWKLGHPTSVKISIAETELADQDLTAAEVVSLDGDGVEVIYRKFLDPTAENNATGTSDSEQWAFQTSVPIKIGRANTRLTVRLLAKEATVFEQRVDLALASRSLPSDQPFVLALGQSMGVEELSRVSADGNVANFTTTVIDNADFLPLDFLEYTAVDCLLISTSDSKFLEEISESQWQAITSWIGRGGSCVVSLNGGSDPGQFPESLLKLLPGTILDSGRVTNPGALESLVVTDERLGAFDATVIDLQRGDVELYLNDNRGRRVPWWVRYSSGHGTMSLVASDLSRDAFDGWKDRKQLWQRLLAGYLDRSVLEASVEESGSRAATYLGYGDMIGQLRATLDVFSSLRVVTFGQISAILLSVLILVGPIDYLISVRWLQRPQLSWYLSGTILLLTTVGLSLMYQRIRPSGILVNSAQIVDLDASNGQVNGRAWSHIYSGFADRFDITPTLGAVSGTVSSTKSGTTRENAERSVGSDVGQTSRIFLDWQGLPGRGLGGLQSELSTDRGMPSYEVQLDAQGGAKMLGVGIPAAGTKCLITTWTDQVELNGESTLREVSRVDQLEGELVNPLPFELKEPVLFYHKWHYALNSRIPAGGSQTISFDMIPKDISRRLNGRKSVDGKVTTERWNPAERGQLDRLLELIMFYKAASGYNYTSLEHRYQAIIDQSNSLVLDKAILVGYADVPAVELKITKHGSTQAETDVTDVGDDESGIQRVVYRIAIPVARPEK